MLVSRSSADVRPDMNLSNPLNVGDNTRKSLPTKRTDVLQIIFKKQNA